MFLYNDAHYYLCKEKIEINKSIKLNNASIVSLLLFKNESLCFSE